MNLPVASYGESINLIVTISGPKARALLTFLPIGTRKTSLIGDELPVGSLIQLHGRQKSHGGQSSRSLTDSSR
jgi:hypothetical protein